MNKSKHQPLSIEEIEHLYAARVRKEIEEKILEVLNEPEAQEKNDYNEGWRDATIECQTIVAEVLGDKS